MSTPSLSQSPSEEFKATLQSASGAFEFKANKVDISKSVDSSGCECWTIKAFHDIFKDSAQKSGLAAIKEVVGIHLNIARETLTDNQPLNPAELPPSLKKNSGSLYRIVDKVSDANNVIDTVENSPGESGHVIYMWNNEKTRISGAFSLQVKDPNQITHQITGYFNILNSGQHLI